MLAAVETVTKADPVWASRRLDANVAAQATARESVHAASPLKRASPRLTVAAGCPVRGAFRTVTLEVGHTALQREHVAGEQMLLVVADHEPHLALHDERLHRERMRVRIDHQRRLPIAFQHFIEAPGFRGGGECLERELLHR